MTWRTLVLSLAVLLLPAAARAQAITVENERSLLRLDRNGAPVAKRPLTLTPEGISRTDCEQDQRIRFALQLAGFAANAKASAWATVAGVDCRQPQSREGNAALCWPVAEAIPLAGAVDVDVPVRRLVSGATTEPVADERVCGAIDFTLLEVQFMIFAPGDTTVPAATKAVSIAVDTIGPEPPPGLRAVPEDGRVRVAWDPPKSASTAMNVYCTESSGMRLCATASGPLATSALVTTDHPVELEVAAIDAFGNEGPRSERMAEGPASSAAHDDGGGCSVASAARPSGTASALAVVLGALGALRRRRLR